MNVDDIKAQYDKLKLHREERVAEFYVGGKEYEKMRLLMGDKWCKQNLIVNDVVTMELVA